MAVYYVGMEEVVDNLASRCSIARWRLFEGVVQWVPEHLKTVLPWAPYPLRGPWIAFYQGVGYNLSNLPTHQEFVPLEAVMLRWFNREIKPFLPSTESVVELAVRQEVLGVRIVDVCKTRAGI